MLHRLILAILLAHAAVGKAEERWSPMHVDHRLVVAFEGRADARNARVRLDYHFENVSREDVDLLLVGMDGERRPLSIAPGGSQSLVVEGPLAISRPTPATAAFRVQTYLDVHADGTEPMILVPAEVHSFAFRAELPEGATLLSSSIPRRFLLGEEVADSALRALPAVSVVYTTAPERVTLDLRPGPNDALLLELRNGGADAVEDLQLTVMVERTATPRAASSPWRLAGDDGVVRQWRADALSIAGGEEIEVELPELSASERRHLRSVTVHNRSGDLIAAE